MWTKSFDYKQVIEAVGYQDGRIVNHETECFDNRPTGYGGNPVAYIFIKIVTSR